MTPDYTLPLDEMSDRDLFYHQLSQLPPPQQEAFLAQFADEDLYRINHDWDFLARPKQRPPQDNWDIWILRAGRGFGKGLALDTPLPTPSGWTTMGEVKVGDELFDEEGNICRITFLSPIHHLPCFEVVFSDGTRVITDQDHRWLTWDKAARRSYGRAQHPTLHPQIRTTPQIKETLKIRRKDGRFETNHSVALAAPLQLPEKELPIDPYLLGCWLGDGASAGGYLYNEDLEIFDVLLDKDINFTLCNSPSDCQEFIKNLSREEPTGDCSKWRIEGLYSQLRLLDLLNNKHIPPLYLRASYSQRLELLQGLLDTDGTISQEGPYIEFCNINQRLAEGVLELTLSLGFKATLNLGRAIYDGKDCGDKYRVNFTAYAPVFKLDRKLAFCGEGEGSPVLDHRYIVEVNPISSVATRCLTVDSPSHLFLCSKSFIPTHNTKTGSEYIVSQALEIVGDYGIFGRTAKDLNLTLINGVSGILAVCRDRNLEIKYNSRDQIITFANGSSIYGYSGDVPDAVRGANLIGCWFDELAFYEKPEEVWDNAQFGRRQKTRRGRTWSIITTTPSAKSSKLLRTLENEPGTVLTVGSSYENLHNLDHNYVKVLQRKEGTRKGREEIYAELLDDAGILWTQSMIHYQPVDLDTLTRIVIGVDPAVGGMTKTAGETGIVVCGKKGDKAWVLADLSCKANPQEVCQTISTAYQQYQANYVVLEVNNGGEWIPAMLNIVDSLIAIKTVRAQKGKRTRAEPIVSLYEQERIFHYQQFATLEDQMIYFDPEKESPDRVDALVWGMTYLFNCQSAPPTSFYLPIY